MTTCLDIQGICRDDEKVFGFLLSASTMCIMEFQLMSSRLKSGTLTQPCKENYFCD